MRLLNNIVFRTVACTVRVLPKSDRKKAFGVLGLLLLNSIMELSGLAMFPYLLTVLLGEDAVENSELLQSIYNSCGFESSEQFISAICGCIFFIFLVKNGLSLLILRTQSRFALRLAKKIALRLHTIYYSKGYAFFKKYNSNHLLFNVLTVTQRFAQNGVFGMLNLINELIIVSVIIMSIAFYNPGILVLLGTTILPIFLVFYLRVKRLIATNGVKEREYSPKVTESVFQSLHGYVDVLITRSRKFFLGEIDFNFGRLINVIIHRNVLLAMPTKVIETAFIGAVCVIVIYGIYWYDDRSDLISLLSLFGIAGYRILPSVNRMLAALMGFQEIEYTFEIVSQVSNWDQLVEAEAKMGELSFNEKISVNSVSYSFDDDPDRLVLKNLSLSVQKGEVLGIVGSSGSGKTTLMNMLLGFVNPNSGTIAVDNTELGFENIGSYHKKIGYVQQQVYLMDATLAENIAFGHKREAIDTEKLHRVIEQARLTDLIEQISDGVDVRVGENGVRLSGGQRQRIGIARALYSDAEILFFDEATSALDSETELEITRAIDALRTSGLTMFIIAHRISTLKNVNRIIQLDHGEIVQECTYDEYISTNTI